MKDVIYLDYAAATPLDDRVLAAMQPYFQKQFYNPSATYLAARAVSSDVQAARGVVAGCLGARPSEVYFTAGGTEANNLAIHGALADYPNGNVVVSAIEHDSVLAPAALYERRIVPVDAQGIVDLVALRDLIDDNTVLVSVMYANNEIGTIQPLRAVADIVSAKRKSRASQTPLYFHSDACQAAQYLDLQVHRLGLDMLTINSGKLYGPKQVGALFVRTGVSIKPQVLGGGQEVGLRSGTENVAGIMGFSTALSLAQSMRHEEDRRLRELQQHFIDGLQQHIPHATINGSQTKRLPNNVHITIPGVDNERLMMQLDEAGIMCAVGSACSASNDEPSHVLMAIGLSVSEAQASLRFTMGRSTTLPDVKRTVEVLGSLLYL